MPVLITATAERQYLGTIRRYLTRNAKRPARPDAARKLIEVYATALAEIAADPRSTFSYPRPYADLARFGFRWIKIHRYWFGYLPAPDPIITNILDEVADMPSRISADTMPVGKA